MQNSNLALNWKMKSSKKSYCCVGETPKKQYIYLDMIKVSNTYGTGLSVLELIHVFEKISGKPLNYTIVNRREGDIEKI